MLNIFHSNWHVAIAVAFVVFSAACVVPRFWASKEFRNNGQRAIDRLRKLELGEPPGPEPTLKPEGSAPQIAPKVSAVLDREELIGLEPAVKPRLPLKVGTKIQAVRNFGPVKNGALGIITGVAELRSFWRSRPTYLCTFADNMKVHARPKQIEAHDHGYLLEELEQPDFATILSRQMTLRAQQFANGHKLHVASMSGLLPKADIFGRG